MARNKEPRACQNGVARFRTLVIGTRLSGGGGKPYRLLTRRESRLPCARRGPSASERAQAEAAFFAASTTVSV